MSQLCSRPGRSTRWVLAAAFGLASLAAHAQVTDPCADAASMPAPAALHAPAIDAEAFAQADGSSSCSQAHASDAMSADAARVQAQLGQAVSPVPEPPGYAMMLVGFALIAVVLRRRRPPRD